MSGQQGELDALAVPAEAVEAAAMRLYGGSGGWDRSTDETDERSMKAFIEGARWFAAQPPRVTPSAKEVARVLADHDLSSDGSILDGDYVVTCTCGANNSDWGGADEHVARAVLALFAAQPTVQQVRDQVAAEIEADSDQEGCGEYDYCHGWVHANQHAARIARGEKGGE